MGLIARGKMVPVERPAVFHRRRNNGYCYTQLFKDVLGSRFNLRETKRIFGKFPKLKDVLLQLARLSSGDVYVHSVVPSGLSLYHVVEGEVELLSRLVIRHMFSDALIGGYDVADDIAVQQSDYARRIASLACISQRNARDMLELTAGVVIKKELAKPDSQLMQFVQDMASDTTRGRKIQLPYRLHPLELTMMQADYPEYTLLNVNNKSHAHAVAGNLRVLAMEVLLDTIGYSKNASPVFGEDVYVVDIGGDYLNHLKMNRLNVHCDTPILTARDSARETTRRLALAAMVRKGKMTRKTFDGLTGATTHCKQRCSEKAQDCGVTGTYAILLHSEYDITREQLAEAFDNHQTKVAVSAVHFDSRIFTQDSFIIESMKARVVVDGQKIHFDFTGDSSLSYSHDKENYLDMVTRNVLITPFGRCYIVEKMGQRGATLFIKYTLCEVEPESRSESMRCCFWMDSADDTMVVSTWRFQNGYYKDSKFVRTGEDDTSGRFLRKHLEVSKRLYEMVLANCLRASDKGFNLSEMLSAAISYNARLTTNGQDVRIDQERLDVDVLIDLVVACYCLAYVLRYGAGKTVEQFTSQERNKRAAGKIGFLGLVSFVVQQLLPVTWMKKEWNCFMEFLSEKRECNDMTFDVSRSVRVVTMEEHIMIMANYGHHCGEATLDTDAGSVDLLDIRNVLELKYEKGKLTGLPKGSGHSVRDSREKTPHTTLIQTSVTPSVVSRSSVSTTTLVSAATGGIKAMKRRTNLAVRTLSRLSSSEPLGSESRVAALKDLRSPSQSTCGPLHVVPMVGDGRCAYYAMLHCLGLSPSAEDVDRLREILWLSCPNEKRVDNGNLILKNLTDLNAWGTTDNFGLFSLLVESGLCVHVLNGLDPEITTRAYSQAIGASHTMHVRWNVCGAGHVDMYECPTFAEDTRDRAANFVRNVQHLLFKIKENRVVLYEETSVIPPHDYVNRSGLKLLSLLASYPGLRTDGRVLDLCGSPGGFLSVLRKLNADVYSVSGPAIDYDKSADGAEIVRLDILSDGALNAFESDSCTLVVADGGCDESYKDATLLKAQCEIIRKVLRKGGNCVLKISNFFDQLKDVEEFFRAFGRVTLEKPDFSASGNTEVYAVCLDFGSNHIETLGETDVRHRLVRGLMRYVVHASSGLNASDLNRTRMLVQVLEANVFGASGENLWRPRGLVGGAIREVPLTGDICLELPSTESSSETCTESADSSAVVEDPSVVAVIELMVELGRRDSGLGSECEHEELSVDSGDFIQLNIEPEAIIEDERGSVDDPKRV